MVNVRQVAEKTPIPVRRVGIYLDHPFESLEEMAEGGLSFHKGLTMKGWIELWEYVLDDELTAVNNAVGIQEFDVELLPRVRNQS